jgi:hypothetical protein
MFASPLILPPGRVTASKNLAGQKGGKWGRSSSIIVTIGAGVPRNPQFCQVSLTYTRIKLPPSSALEHFPCLLLPERALKEGKTFSDMANELVEIGLFDPKEAEE